MILLDDFKDSLKAGRFLRESDLGIESENADWKPVILDENSGEMVAPNGTMGQRWEEGKQWNLNLKRDDGSAIDPAMSVEKFEGEQINIEFPFFDNSGNGTFTRPIMAKKSLWLTAQRNMQQRFMT